MKTRHDPQPANAANAFRPTVFVLGGSGFIGRHAVAALRALDCRVVIGSRHPARIGPRLPTGARSCERRRVRLERMLEASAWRAVLRDVDVVINCVGILRQRGRETYERVHHLAPAALAAACHAGGQKLIHVSALGLAAGNNSRFLKSKRAGEKALRASRADWYIVRPSLLDGDGGFGAKWLRRMARGPVHVVPAGATGRIAALDVRDLGEALARLALRVLPESCDAVGNREFDLGGPVARTLADHLLALRRLHTARPARQLPVPAWIARPGAHACDLLHLTPFSYGHWELLRRDNCPRHNRLPELLGRRPRSVGATANVPAMQPIAGPAM